MSKIVCIIAFASILALPAIAESSIPDLRGTWKGESESIVMGSGNPHHPATQSAEPEFRSVSFTLTVDKQDGRRFTGIFSSARHTERVIAILSRAGVIHMVSETGYNSGTLLAPNRMELCYQHLTASSRIVSCTELIKQP